MQPKLPWDKLDMELWFKIIAFESQAKGIQADSGITLLGHSGQSKDGKKKQLRPVCWDFNSHGSVFVTRVSTATNAQPVREITQARHPNWPCLSEAHDQENQKVQEGPMQKGILERGAGGPSSSDGRMGHKISFQVAEQDIKSAFRLLPVHPGNFNLFPSPTP